MRHAHVNFIDASDGSTLEQLVKHRNDRFATFERKAFLTQIFLMQKLLKLLGLDQLLQQFFLRLES